MPGVRFRTMMLGEGNPGEEGSEAEVRFPRFGAAWTARPPHELTSAEVTSTGAAVAPSSGGM